MLDIKYEAMLTAKFGSAWAQTHNMDAFHVL